jgi:hypothetical protein
VRDIGEHQEERNEQPEQNESVIEDGNGFHSRQRAAAGPIYKTGESPHIGRSLS